MKKLNHFILEKKNVKLDILVEKRAFRIFPVNDQDVAKTMTQNHLS